MKCSDSDEVTLFICAVLSVPVSSSKGNEAARPHRQIWVFPVYMPLRYLLVSSGSNIGDISDTPLQCFINPILQYFLLAVIFACVLFDFSTWFVKVVLFDKTLQCH